MSNHLSAVSTMANNKNMEAIPFVYRDEFHGASIDELYQYATKLNASNSLSDEKLQHIAAAFNQVQDILATHNTARFSSVRQARLS